MKKIKKPKRLKKKTAMLIIDMISPFDFPDGKQLAVKALPTAKRILRLKRQAQKQKIPFIYLNDNHGKWRSDQQETYANCVDEKSVGCEIAKLLQPEGSDYFIFKPRHSGFYGTNLEILLKDLQVSNLIVTGLTANLCVLFTVHDAHMRDFNIWVPSDCTIAQSPAQTRSSLEIIKKGLKVRTAVSQTASLDF